MPIDVKLVAETNIAPETIASHAAKVCYEPEMPEMGKMIDVKGRLFDTGHHTTIQHSYFTFAIEGISVAGVCMGLHLATPHYNTDQRSGRFSKMYDEPDIDAIAKHLKTYYPKQDLAAALSFIQKGLDIYAKSKDNVTKIAADKIKYERPFASEKYIASNAPKFAQEHLRMFISMVAPTALDYTINLSTLTALYRTAWTPEMRDTVSKMVNIITQKYPEISYMFDESKKSNTDWAPELLLDDCFYDPVIQDRPKSRKLDVSYDNEKFAIPEMNDMVDTLYFSPKYMGNTQMHVMNEVEMSCATMGQDQRHRSIKRSAPGFTGKLYLPPLLKEAGLAADATDYMYEFLGLKSELPSTLWSLIAPYGAMVRYTKKADLNALLHEQGKRTCWCAQEEIYHLGTQLREQLADKIGSDSKLVTALAPHCFKDGKCCEGARFCGRDIKERMIANYFKNRQI
jgi:thymidylate synthase ThyX